MQPVGYIVMQHTVRLYRPVKAYQRSIARIPNIYREAVLDESENSTLSIAEDPHCLALIKHYQSLMPLAQEAHKPIFHLKPADGAIGSHLQAVQSVYGDFQNLGHKIAETVEIPILTKF